jgi:hypothetical protein
MLQYKEVTITAASPASIYYFFEDIFPARIFLNNF